MNDEQRLIEGILAGHTDDYAVLVDRYGAEVYAIALRIVGNPQDAEDVAQDALVKAFSRLDTFNKRSKFSTWLMRIAYNLAISTQRRQSRATALFSDVEIEAVSDTMADSLLDEVAEQRVAALREAIEQLSPADQALLSLFYFDNRSLKEIAYIISQRETTIATRLSRIRKKLYLLLNK
ncbi:MAG: RNA polymerase sigma factor [Bacteroidaceae bacterium]|nr:RNA polymerase sigma factor [Bacteroidaceae bacterium]